MGLGLGDFFISSACMFLRTHLLTGYAGSSSFLRALIKVYKILRQSNPNIQFVCDPVLGDDGKFYVAREMLDVYRFEVVPLANVLTPNAFELGVRSTWRHTQDEGMGFQSIR